MKSTYLSRLCRASHSRFLVAKGNVPLSIAMTSVSTLLAPIMTPLINYLEKNPLRAKAIFCGLSAKRRIK
ncbi:hypothetical protein J7E95_17540 [Streptomyces sp. ISL-14]|nr:hypothetical protein [Streptomyces sp. ISL-14]